MSMGNSGVSRSKSSPDPLAVLESLRSAREELKEIQSKLGRAKNIDRLHAEANAAAEQAKAVLKTAKDRAAEIEAECRARMDDERAQLSKSRGNFNKRKREKEEQLALKEESLARLRAILDQRENALNRGEAELARQRKINEAFAEDLKRNHSILKDALGKVNI